MLDFTSRFLAFLAVGTLIKMQILNRLYLVISNFILYIACDS